MNDRCRQIAEKVSFEDIRVGLVFRSAEHSLHASDKREFASSFEPKPFHIDGEVARDCFFAWLISRGWHTAAITMMLVAESIPLVGGVVGVGSNILRTRVYKPGDALHVISTVIEIKPASSTSDRGVITLQSETFNQNEVLCQRSVARLVHANEVDIGKPPHPARWSGIDQLSNVSIN